MSPHPTIEGLFQSDADRWQAVLARDPRADGVFWYSVRSTGVFCRPSCASRPARREHVRFHPSIAHALQAGFRPCQRCRPDEPPLAERRATAVAEACRLIDAAAEPPTLADLAAAIGLSPHHLHRLFKAVTGVTPHAYAAASRAERLRTLLPQSDSITRAVYAAGYQAASRFHEHSAQTLGMTATRYRAGGRGLTIRYACGASSLGQVLVAATPTGLCAVLLGDDPARLRDDLRRRFPQAEIVEADPDFATTVARVVALIETPQQGLTLPLDIQGTAFQQRVWQALTRIAPGETVTYTELARRIGTPSSVRAVAAACAANPVAVAIPCHRVVRSDGGLAGYYWGLERKAELLRRESVRDQQEADDSSR